MTGVRPLSHATPALSPDLVFEARHFAYGNVGCLVEWLRGSLEATPAQLAKRMFACMPAVLREAYADGSSGLPRS